MNRINQIGITLLICSCTDASAATYACTMFGKTFTVTLGSANDLGFTAIPTDCQRLIDNHWSGFGMEERFWDE